MLLLSQPHAEERPKGASRSMGLLPPSFETPRRSVSRRRVNALMARLLRMRAGLAFALFFAICPGPLLAQPADIPALATYLGPDREQRLIEGAKREGELMLYSSMQHESVLPLQK